MKQKTKRNPSCEEIALNNLNNIRQFLKERGLFDEPCEEGSQNSIGDAVEKLTCHVDVLHKEEALKCEKHSLYWEREKEMQTDAFKSDYNIIHPHRMIFTVWCDSTVEGMEQTWEPYERGGRWVQLEHPHDDWVQDNWDTPISDLAKKLTLDDLVECYEPI